MNNEVRYSGSQLLFFFASIFISCTATENKIQPEVPIEIVNNELIKERFSKSLDSLKQVYNLQFRLDTLNYVYSIEYSDVLSSDYQLIQSFSINDILNDSNSVIIKGKYSVYSDFRSQVFYFEFKTDSSISRKFINYEASRQELKKSILGGLGNCANRNLLIVKASSFVKIDRVIKALNEDGEDVSVEIEDANSFFIRGQLIDYVSVPTAPSL